MTRTKRGMTYCIDNAPAVEIGVTIQLNDFADHTHVGIRQIFCLIYKSFWINFECLFYPSKFFQTRITVTILIHPLFPCDD